MQVPGRILNRNYYVIKGVFKESIVGRRLDRCILRVFASAPFKLPFVANYRRGSRSELELPPTPNGCSSSDWNQRLNLWRNHGRNGADFHHPLRTDNPWAPYRLVLP